MKKIIALLLALVLCCGVFAACAQPDAGKTDPTGTTAPQPTEPAATIEDALAYLSSMYKPDEGKSTPADYKLAAQIDIEGAKFTITWTASIEGITFVEENGLITAKVPTKNDTETEYTLTATVKDAAGKTLTKEFKRVLPVYDNSSIVSELVEGEPYKMFLVQVTAGKTLYALGETQSDNKYIKTDIDPKKGLDFYGEKVEGGYKFYTTIDGVKNYVHAKTVTGDDGKVSKYLGYATESDCVYYFKAETKAWYVMIDNVEYVLGTYSDYTTMCISEATYMTPETTGVTQFPVSFMAKAEAEALAPTEGPKDPTELSTIPQILEIAGALADKGQTTEKYLVKGKIVEIKSEQYGNMYIEDEAGNKLYVYGVYSKDGSTRYDSMNPKPAVGDTVTLMGVLSKYNDEPQMKNGWVQELVSAGGNNNSGNNNSGNNNSGGNNSAPTGEYAKSPEVGKTYKLGLYNTNKNAVYYFTGTMSDYYGATETDASKAVGVTVESAGEGKYYLSFTVGGAKKYVGTEVNGTHLNFIIVDEANRATFTWNSEHSTFVTIMSDGTEAFMGTYNNYVTVGMSKLEKIGTSYPVHLYY